jgi:GTP pyrophosphokinase
VKLCDRLRNIRTLQYLPPSKQVKIAEETLNFFTPFAHRLGLKKLQNELESRSFYFYNYTQYKQILDFLKVKKRNFTEYMYILVDAIKNSINELNIPHKINVMHKQEYEIFEIMQSGKKIEDIDDIFSIEILLNTKDAADCLQIHKHLVDKFETVEYMDLQNNPTVNDDNSVSAELFGLNGRIHISIRTQKMQENAFNIITQKIIDKSFLLGGEISDEDIELWTNWMARIIETKGKDDAARLIWTSIKNNVYNARINISTKDGTVLSLPKSATVIDFAFALSREIGITLITCKINGVVKNIFTELKNGDKVEIITSPKCHPDSSWLNHTVSFRAIAHLTNYFQTSFDLKLNSDTSISNLELRTNREQLFRITGINNNDFLLSKIRNTIGQDNIKRIAISPNTNIFETSIQTNFPSDKIDNDLFLKLIYINGVKSVLVQQ